MSNKNCKWYTDRYRTKIGVISTGTYYDIFVYNGLKNKGVNKKSLQILVKVLDFFKNIIYNK